MKALKIVGVIVGVLIVLIALLFASGRGGEVAFRAFVAFNEPQGEFSAAKVKTPAPDYSDAANWAARPDMLDPADLSPAGVNAAVQGQQPVDVFYIHPTGFLTTASWISPMDPDSGTEENTKWMMANQASAYNGCCNVYAPRYREANIFAYFKSPAERDDVLSFAYEDVKRAFEHYLEHDNDGRPFVVASHSQGSHHGMRLVKEVIDASDLHERMVAAYLVGAVLIPLSEEWFAGMQHVKACETHYDLHCVVHWDTMPEGADPIDRPADSLCTNPLSWRVDEEVASADLNHGAVVPVGSYNITMGREDDVAKDVVFDQMLAPREGQTSAQCRDGTLFAERQTDPGFAVMGSGTTDSYHGLDYALFYMNIYNNARLRVQTYLDQLARKGPSTQSLLPSGA